MAITGQSKDIMHEYCLGIKRLVRTMPESEVMIDTRKRMIYLMCDECIKYIKTGKLPKESYMESIYNTIAKSEKVKLD